MSTTSLKLPEEIKLKAAAAAREQGVTPHAFMVDAIRRAAFAAEQRSQFVADAVAAHVEMLETGLGHDGADVRDYLRRRLADSATPRLEKKAWRS